MDGTIPTNDDAAERKDKQPTAEEDERRCDAVAQLLLEGKKGEELAQAVPNLRVSSGDEDGLSQIRRRQSEELM